MLLLNAALALLPSVVKEVPSHCCLPSPLPQTAADPSPSVTLWPFSGGGSLSTSGEEEQERNNRNLLSSVLAEEYIMGNQIHIRPNNAWIRLSESRWITPLLFSSSWGTALNQSQSLVGSVLLLPLLLFLPHKIVGLRL